MINSYPKRMHLRERQGGVASMIVAVILLSVTLLLMFFVSSHGILQTKAAANQFRYTSAFAAAEAGLDYGVLYLTQNRATILANTTNDYMTPYTDGNISNVNLNNGAKFSINYSNPIAKNYQIIKITATGNSDDNSATVTMSQLVASKGSLLVTPPTLPATSVSKATLRGSATIVNAESALTLRLGSTVSITGNATTTSKTSSSNKNKIGADIQQRVTTLKNYTPSQLFTSYFEQSTTQIKNSVDQVYTNGSTVNLTGKKGVSIWIEDNLSLGTSQVIGSASSPVILIVNGNMTTNGTIVVYGFVFVMGNLTMNGGSGGSSQLIGGVAVYGNLVMGGSDNITFDSNVINNLQSQSSGGTFIKMPGSWRDF